MDIGYFANHNAIVNRHYDEIRQFRSKVRVEIYNYMLHYTMTGRSPAMYIFRQLLKYIGIPHENLHSYTSCVILWLRFG